MKRLTPLILLVLCILAGCGVAAVQSEVAPPAFAAGADELPVEGLAQWTFEHKVSFGDFQTDQLRRGWSPSRPLGGPQLRTGTGGSPVLDVLDLPYMARLKNAPNKLQFSIHDRTTHWADFYGAKNVSNRELQTLSPLWGKDAATFARSHAEAFTGVILGPRLDSTNVWNILLGSDIPTPETAASVPATVGLVGDQDRVLLAIRQDVRRMAPNPQTGAPEPLPAPQFVGYEIIYHNEPIALVDLQTPQGKIWLKSGLQSDLRFLTASTAAAVLLWTRPFAPARK
ncbi:hypothetical protein [Hymenobacter jejuensis]|uniref:Uncharacterized protein n=1 Tax=Hymenobacter jejuensis TaxID=2502781 RepID=A0A5B8A406_9BACT|nr:hypothetical protein [Hymenobacter jejuensis]QDA61889.1 hypothetical protein FHG12_18085 [Hymenobacter jejuensis]